MTPYLFPIHPYSTSVDSKLTSRAVGSSENLVGQPIVNFIKTYRKAALPAPPIPQALFSYKLPIHVLLILFESL